MDTIVNNDDPRLTAYALGELDASERPAVEAFLEQSAEGRALVEESRALAGLLSAELGTEPGPGLTDDQHRVLDQALASERSKSAGTVLQLRLWLPAAAALLLVGVVIWQLEMSVLPPHAQVGGEQVAFEHAVPMAMEPMGYLGGDGRTAKGGKADLADGTRLGLQHLGYLDGDQSGTASPRQKASTPPADSPFVYDLFGGDAPADHEVQPIEEGRLDFARNSNYPASAPRKQRPQNMAMPRAAQGDAEDADLAVRSRLEKDEAPALRDETVNQRDEVGGERRGGGHGGQYTPPAGASDGSVAVAPPTNPGAASTAAPDALVGGQGGGGAGERVDSFAEFDSFGAAKAPVGGGAEGSSSASGRARFSRPALHGADDDAVATSALGQKLTAHGPGAVAKGQQGAPATAAAPAAAGEPLSAEMLNELEALGYLGAARLVPETKTSESESDDRVDRLRALGYFSGGSDRREAPSPRATRESRGESYAPIHENPFVPLSSDPMSRLSTFGVDVDTASYANVRRYLNMGQAPPPNAVRLEELVNYFSYDDPAPGNDDEVPFAVSVESAAAPWAPDHRLVRVALKGAEHLVDDRPASNLVFLADVSGSMKSSDKLPLLVASLKLLLEELDGDDRVALVTYASGSRTVLPSTPCSDKATILAALDRLTAGGSTHASAGIQQAYQVASSHFIEGGVNRVILATDGDFNVGITQEGDLEQFIEGKARSGVFLTVLGFGTGNLKDSKAEALADRGNGNYAYIDTLNEAYKVLVREMGGTLITIAKDVKIQVEFNPSKVAAYRQLGYENRALAAADFKDDRKDAGEIGAGHSVVALYEVVPVGVGGVPGTADLRYGQAPEPVSANLIESDDLLTVNLRYKLPDASTSTGFAVPFVDAGTGFLEASDDFRFSAAVAAFGMVLRHSAYRGSVSLGGLASVAEAARGADPDGYRSEFVRLVRIAQGLPGY